MRLKIRRQPKEIDEGVVTKALMKHWRNNADAKSYLKTRFQKGHATGDFLKSIIEVREE